MPSVISWMRRTRAGSSAVTSCPLPTPVPRDSMWVLTWAMTRVLGPQVALDVLAHLVGLAQREVVVDLQVQVNQEAAAGVMDADIVDGGMVVGGDGAGALGHALALVLARVGVDDDVGAGGNGLDLLLHGLGHQVGVLEGEVAVHVDGHVDEEPGAGAADAHLADAEHALGAGGGGGDLGEDAGGGAVQQDLHGALAQIVGDEGDDDGDAQGGDGIGLGQELHVLGKDVLPQPDQAEAAEDDPGAPDVGLRSAGRRPPAPGCRACGRWR